MGLVDYSDSDDSGAENTPKATKPAPKTGKETFQKVVDRSNPGKIRVQLPGAAAKDASPNDEPAAKRIKTGGGGLSDFKSFLPPPKRAAQPTVSLGNGTKGLAPGFRLKTGAEPGFSREAVQDAPGFDNDEIPNETAPATKAPEIATQTPAEEVKLVGKPLMFKPLSVARNTKKKPKTAVGVTAATIGQSVSTSQTGAEAPAQKLKVSLFSVATEKDEPAAPSSGDYQPILYQPAHDEPEDQAHDADPCSNPTPTHQPPPPNAQSLQDIASDLNLSAAERRQLFGRGGNPRSSASATKIINFNTDEEYRHNEELRASGEAQAVHNPVRAIAPGKHSLKQLVNAAQSQKEALEESFAKGKSTRAEAGSRYGW
jgi:hypothetical protein